MADHDSTTGRPTTIVVRLRDATGWVDRQDMPAPDWDALLAEAAAEIERLGKENHALQLRIQDGWKRIEETEEALSVIARRVGGSGCEHVTSSRSACRGPNSRRLRTSARGTAEEWCDACVALDALGVPFRG